MRRRWRNQKMTNQMILDDLRCSRESPAGAACDRSHVLPRHAFDRRRANADAATRRTARECRFANAAACWERVPRPYGGTISAKITDQDDHPLADANVVIVPATQPLKPHWPPR